MSKYIAPLKGELSDFIKTEIQLRQWSNKNAADMLNTTSSTITHVLTDPQRPSLETYIKLVDRLDYHLTFIAEIKWPNM